jgi:hypothetical protein
MPSPADLLRTGQSTGALTFPAADRERKLQARLGKRGRGLFAVEGFQRNQVITTVEGRVADYCDRTDSDEVQLLPSFPTYTRTRIMRIPARALCLSLGMAHIKGQNLCYGLRYAGYWKRARHPCQHSWLYRRVLVFVVC